MRLKLFLALAAAGLALAGCASTQDRRLADTERCRSYGFRKQSDAFSRCMLDIDLERSAANRASLANNWGPGMYGPGYYRGAGFGGMGYGGMGYGGMGYRGFGYGGMGYGRGFYGPGLYRGGWRGFHRH